MYLVRSRGCLSREARLTKRVGRYFELSRVDAERAIAIYKVFTKQTDQVVQYLSIARQYEHVTRLEIPKIKHAPTSLVNSLQEYLDDNDFDVNRRQFIAEQQLRKGGSSGTATRSTKNDAPSSKSDPKPVQETTARPTEAAKQQQPTKGPAPDLIDFFDSIEQNQQPMAQQPAQQYPQSTAQGFQQGFPQQQAQSMPNAPVQVPHQTNPFGQPAAPQQQLQPQFTGMGFGGYGPQPQQQFVQPNNFPNTTQQGMQQPVQQPAFVAPQQTGAPSTNPFRQSMMATGASSFSPNPPQQQFQQQSTNPFARSTAQQGQSASAPQSQISSPIQVQNTSFPQPQHSQFGAPQIQPQQTGTNPFARSQPQQQQPTGSVQSPPAMAPMVTGSTNPFRQSAFVNQQTGQGWQTGSQGTMGGWEQMQTVPVFPRPGQPQQ